MKPCEICSSERIIDIFDKNDFHYQKCKDCGFIRIFPQPDDKTLDNIYNGGYYKRWGGEGWSEIVFRNMKKKTFCRLISMQPYKNGINFRLLDIGAATGLLMETAQEYGYDAFGIEASSDGAEMIEKKFGKDKLFNCYFDENFSKQYANCKFNVIVMSDLYEHLKDVNASLDTVRDLLSPNGYVLLAMPDASSLTCKLFGKHWPHFLTEHLFTFSSKNISAMLNKHNFQVLSIKSEKKYLTLEYIKNWFGARNTPLDIFLSHILRVIPKFLEQCVIPYKLGQMVVIARKL
jgi:2-polyprenyl-3-methyl-5-hydroxy-6-metoxy-1,4-benzoquinol methylase